MTNDPATPSMSNLSSFNVPPSASYSPLLYVSEPASICPGCTSPLALPTMAYVPGPSGKSFSLDEKAASETRISGGPSLLQLMSSGIALLLARRDSFSFLLAQYEECTLLGPSPDSATPFGSHHVVHSCVAGAVMRILQASMRGS